MSIAARAVTMTNEELLALFAVSSEEEQNKLARELFRRLEHLDANRLAGFNSYHSNQR
jgi:hypothetical protein